MTAAEHLDYQSVEDLVETLTAAGLNAAVALEDVRYPGVWVQPRAVQPDDLTGRQALRMRLVLIHGDTDTVRAYKGLFDLFNQLVDVIDLNAGDANFVGVSQPENSTLMPGLAVPFDLYPINPEE